MIDLNTIKEMLLAYNQIVKNSNIIGIAKTGSSLIGLADSQSDLDLVLIYKGGWIPVTSNLLSFYDLHDGNVIELLTEDVLDISELTQQKLYGYSSWAKFLMPKRQILFTDVKDSFQYNLFTSLIQKYNKLWLHGMIKGYDSSITTFIDAVTQNNFSILTKKITKEIYHLYYTYTEIANKVLNLNLILKLKRCNLNEIDINELKELCLILEELKTSYIFSPEDELINIELFKQEALKIWMN